MRGLHTMLCTCCCPCRLLVGARLARNQAKTATCQQDLPPLKLWAIRIQVPSNYATHHRALHSRTAVLAKARQTLQHCHKDGLACSCEA